MFETINRDLALFQFRSRRGQVGNLCEGEGFIEVATPFRSKMRNLNGDLP